jgi:prefoldin subunit 5
MSYDNQIRILEAKLKQLEQSTDKKDLEKLAQVINDLRRLRRLKWEDEHERVNFDDER